MITISPGHWKTGGAVDLMNEVVEARKVVNRVVGILQANGVKVNHLEDNTSVNQQQNLHYIVTQHNKTQRKLDVSVHFNSSVRKVTGVGTEVLYYDEKTLATKVSAAIAKTSKLKDRGAKERKELAFLRGTSKPAILIEVCFVSSEYDCKMYRQNFESICQAIAKELAAYVGYRSKSDIDPKHVYHTVVIGDTLYSIAKKYKITVNHIKSLNNLKTSAIKSGQKLQIK